MGRRKKGRFSCVGTRRKEEKKLKIEKEKEPANRVRMYLALSGISMLRSFSTARE